jgi:hypothetical protein
VPLSEDQKAMLRLLAQREQGYEDIGALMGIGVDEVRAKVKAALDGLDAGLSQDQKAILRLQAQREEGYGDIAALMGIGVDEVRAKVKDALAGLDQEPAAESGAPEAAPPPPEPSPPAEPRPPAPASPAPAPPAPKPAAKAAAAPKAKKAASPRLKLPEDKGALRALAAGAAVIVVIVVLLVTGVLGGSDDSGSTEATTTATAETTASGESTSPTASGKQPTQALLSAVDGGDGKGQALFGRSGKSVILLLSAKGVQPSPTGQSYTVSLVRSESQRLPLVATKTKNGVIAGRFKIAPQVLGLLAGGFDQMEVSLVDDDTLRVALAQARKSKKAPNYSGTPVLAGPVTGPIVEAGEAEAGN